MKQTLFLIAFFSFSALGIVSAQSNSDTIQNRATELNQSVNQETQDAQRMRDTLADPKTLNQSEKKVLDKDYNRAKEVYNSDKQDRRHVTDDTKKLQRQKDSSKETPNKQ